MNATKKNTICLWYNSGAEEAARFYAGTFPDSSVGAVHRAPSDFPGGKAGDVLTVEFTVCGVSCKGLNGGDSFKHSEAFSFQIATDDQVETDRYWNAIVGNGGTESACGWRKDKWGLSWQITPRALTEAMANGGDAAKRAFGAMMTMQKIDVAQIEAAVLGESSLKVRNDTQKITVETSVKAPIAEVWRAYTTATDIQQWHAASDDWHTTAAKVDLPVGGEFSLRMEAKDGRPSSRISLGMLRARKCSNGIAKLTFGHRSHSIDDPSAENRSRHRRTMLGRQSRYLRS